MQLKFSHDLIVDIPNNTNYAIIIQETRKSIKASQLKEDVIDFLVIKDYWKDAIVKQPAIKIKLPS